MVDKINKLLFLKLILIIFLGNSCNNRKANPISSSDKISQHDSIQLITKLISNEEFISELPICDKETPFVIVRNGYIKNTYNIKFKEHSLVLKSLVDILYINGKYEDNPIKEMPIYRIGPKVLIEIAEFKVKKDSVFVKMTLCGNGTFFNFSFKKNSNGHWEANLLQKGNT